MDSDWRESYKRRFMAAPWLGWAGQEHFKTYKFLFVNYTIRTLL